MAELATRCSNSGRWGADDERGALNLIGPEQVLEAIRTVTAGESLSLAYDLPVWEQTDGSASLEVMHEGSRSRGAADRLTTAPHGCSITHVDALGHVYHCGHAYNGRRPGEILTDRGLAFGAITAMSQGILARGLLLDVAGARGVQSLQEGDGISRDDLLEAERQSGTVVREGDAIFVRSGIGQDRRWFDPATIGGRPGVLPEAIPWLYEKGVALYSGDCIERLPQAGDTGDMPLHEIGLASMGLAMLDNAKVEVLREACARHLRSHFLLVVAPLRVPGGTGSAVNPLAVF
jgi:kynurenine formamidase